MADIVASVPELTKRTFSIDGNGLDDGLGEIGFGGRRGSEAGAVARGFDDGFNDLGRRVAEKQRSPGTDVVDVGVAVGVVDTGAFSANQEGRIAADRAEGAHGRVHAAGNELFSAFLEFAGDVRVFGP